MKKYSKILLAIFFAFFASISVVNAKEMTIEEFGKLFNETNPDASYVYVIGEYAFSSKHILTTQDAMIAARTIKLAENSGATDKDPIYGAMTAFYLEVNFDDDFNFLGLEAKDNKFGTTKAPEKYDIKYIDYVELKEEIKLEKPTLFNNTLIACGNSPECEDFKPELTDGKYSYDLGINSKDYETTKEGEYSVSGYDVFEKNGENYVLVKTAVMGGAAAVEVQPGESKTYVAAVYVISGEEKIYSEYSNEIVIDHSKLETPTLSNAFGGATVNGTLRSRLNILTEGAYADLDLLNSVTGYELYEKNGDEYTLILTKLTTDEPFDTPVELQIGEKKTYVVRVFISPDDYTRIYSDYSNEITLDNSKLETPTLINNTLLACGNSEECKDFKPELVDGKYIYDLGINSNNYSTGNEGEYTVSGYDVFEKAGENYILVKTAVMAGAAVVEIKPGESKTYVAAVYMMNGEEKIYSEYSNEIVIDHSKLETPVLTYDWAGAGEKDGNVFSSYALKISPIYDGVEIYYATGGSEYILSSEITSNDEFGIINVPAGFLYYVKVRGYIEAEGQTIYSTYSNVIKLDESQPAPKLTWEAAGDSTTGGLYSLKVSPIYDGVELYYTTTENGEYSLLIEGTGEKPFEVEVPTGLIYYVKARTYVIYNNQKIYSPYSYEVELDCRQPVPELTTEFYGDTQNGALFGLSVSPIYDGIEIYYSTELDGEYTLFAEGTGEDAIEMEVPVDLTYYVYAQSYVEYEGHKIYSPSSNIMLLNGGQSLSSEN